jgi:hypothetical protein
MKEVILSIAGRPGLYRLVAQGNNNLIVETIDAQKKRTIAGTRERVTSLNDVCMYTEEEDKPLMEIFESCKQVTGGKTTEFTHKDATNDQLVEFMAAAVPNFDRDRVYTADIKKLISWYNLLIENGYNNFEDQDSYAAEAQENIVHGKA